MRGSRRKLEWVRRRLDRWVRLWYRRHLGDEGVAVSIDENPRSNTMLLTFGGMKSAGGIASFEFVRMTQELGVKRMYVRDPRQSWYHRGMAGHGTTLEGVADVLRGILEQQDVRRLVVVGNSAGGYAALLFGALLKADVVLAFGAQTTLRLDALHAMGDRRWDEMLGPIYAKGAVEERWADLAEALPHVLAPSTHCKIFFDEHDRDRDHAERLAAIPNVHLYRFGRGGHRIVRSLRDCGALDRLLRQALLLGPADGSVKPAGGSVESAGGSVGPADGSVESAGGSVDPAPEEEALRFRVYRRAPRVG